MRSRTVTLVLLASFLAGGAAISRAAEFVNFESPMVHPIEISPDGSRLFAVNPSDHRVAVFDLPPSGPPVPIDEIQVGIEPVTVRARTNSEIWVVNHISDSISIIDLSVGAVIRTLLTDDEPTDVVFAGVPERAFVCVSQRDMIRVFDPADLDAPPIDLPLDMSDPFALAVSPDGATVWVTALDSGNQTTVIPHATVTANGGLPPADPPMSAGLPAAPATALILRHDGTHWTDEIGRNWDGEVGYSLLDADVIGISANGLAVTQTITGVGTSLFGIAVHPSTGRLYVGNQEAFNEVRFEPNLKGQFLHQRVTTIDPLGPTVLPRHLNEHIDYGNEAGSESERALSLSLPLGLATSSSGDEVFVSAFGSAKVGVLDSDGIVIRRIDVGAGPGGLAYDAGRNRLYVHNRIDNTVSVVDLSDDSSDALDIGFDPTPDGIRHGRELFYDGRNSSAHGDLSCASCHLFGGMDNLAWDLGDPLGTFIPNPTPGLQGFHPMKGPMTTQSLKALEGTEPLHWRGDRNTLGDFNAAFVSLLGRASELAAADFSDFEDFVFSMRYPPNPNRELDGTLPNPAAGPNATVGEQAFLSGNLVGGLQCVDCHALPSGENGLIIPASVLAETQDMVVPQLRNMYEKTRFDNTAATNVRGFGYTNEGATDDLFTFLQFPAFTFDNDAEREDVIEFLLAFDTGTHATSGQQWTMNGTNEAAGLPRVQTFETVADLGLSGLIAKGVDSGGEMRGWLYQPGGTYLPDRESEPSVTRQDLLDLAAPGHEVTFSAVVAGTEVCLGIDRDGDGFRDRDELDAGSDPGDPSSIPSPSNVPPAIETAANAVSLGLIGPHPAANRAELRLNLPESGRVALSIHDVQGRVVQVLLNTEQQVAGQSTVSWNLRDGSGRGVPAGVYFARLASDHGEAVKRIVVSR